ncbi:MAG: S41 family peptidase [Chloroflexota bacterium]|nr:S41 family peptidase [Chloroflexota bacterium]
MAQRLRVALGVLSIVVTFVVGFVAGQLTPVARAGPSMQSQAEDSPYLERFERIWQLVHLEYYEQPLDDEALIQGAIHGMLETLGDQHTAYMPPQEFRLFSEDLSGSYTGIGALVEAEDDRLLIVSPFDGSPADVAGLRPSDEILQVDDTPVSSFDDPMSAITLVRGPEGEPVNLRIKRDDNIFDVTIVRATIPLVSASGEMQADGIGYVRISAFSQTTVPQLREALTEILAQDPKGLVIDLRGNPGGSLDTALQVSSEFIGDGTVMREQWGNGQEESRDAHPGGLAIDPGLSLIVLVDGGSASASEIVAGAIRDRERGQLLGETTYGKGTVQNWHDLGAEHGGLRVTIARWLTPDGTWVHGEGLTPDVLVELTDAEREGNRDIQLESAVNVLLGKPLPARAMHQLGGHIVPKWRLPRYE